MLYDAGMNPKHMKGISSSDVAAEVRKELGVVFYGAAKDPGTSVSVFTF